MKVEACVKDIDRWMLENRLKLNSGKAKLLVYQSKFRPRPPVDSLIIVDILVVLKDLAKNIGVVFDTCMKFNQHVTDICRTAFYHIRNISRVRRFLSNEWTKMLVHTLATSRMDSCNGLIYGLPKYLTQRLQYVQTLRYETSLPVPNGWTYFSNSYWIALIASGATYNLFDFIVRLRQLMAPECLNDLIVLYIYQLGI